MMTLSKSTSMDGSTNITTRQLTMAPRAMKNVMELIISILEYIETPMVAAKNPNALTQMEAMDFECAILMASFGIKPALRSRLYLVVMSIA